MAVHPGKSVKSLSKVKKKLRYVTLRGPECSFIIYKSVLDFCFSSEMKKKVCAPNFSVGAP